MKILTNMRKHLNKNLLRNERGQGATEYILLLVVIVGLVVMFGPKIKKAVEGQMTAVESGMSQVTSDNK